MDNAYLRIAQEALWLTLTLSLFPLLASLVVGLVISLLQALTQVQEQTLTFVPKVVITILVIAVTFTWMVTSLTQFTNSIFDLMLRVGSGR